MSGFVERVVEDWLTRADERSYQWAFAAALARSGHTIRYISPHSTLEHGKDIITTKGSKVHAYQLKAGNVPDAVWRKISEEVREAATVPIDVPGLPRRTADRAYLVLTGRVSDAVRNKIALINDDHRRRRFAPIEIIDLGALLGLFTRVFESFCPSGIGSLQSLVRLYLRDPRAPQDKAELWTLLTSIADDAKTTNSSLRSMSSVVVAANFLATPYAATDNHIAAADTWLLASSTILRFAQKHRLAQKHWLPFLRACMVALDAIGDAYLSEVWARKDFLESDPILDSAFLGHRRTVVLGYAAAFLLCKRIRGQDVTKEATQLLAVTIRQLPLEVWGEGAWNYQLNLALALGQVAAGGLLSEQLVDHWLAYTCPQSGESPRDVYWSVSDAVSISKFRDEQMQPKLELSPTSYSAGPAMSFLVRRMRRQSVAGRWAAFSKRKLAEVTPASRWMEFEWQIEKGSTRLEVLPMQGSWAVLRRLAFAERSRLFPAQAHSLLPLFLCVYPHRVTRALSGELDYLVAPPPFQAEWTVR